MLTLEWLLFLLCVFFSSSFFCQEDEEEAPQPKALKVPPEVKPKPQSPPPTAVTAPPLAAATATAPPLAAAPAAPVAVAEREDEDEGDKIMAELQVGGHGTAIRRAHLPLIHTHALTHTTLSCRSHLNKHRLITHRQQSTNRHILTRDTQSHSQTHTDE